MARITDSPDMTSVFYHGGKATNQTNKHFTEAANMLYLVNFISS